MSDMRIDLKGNVVRVGKDQFVVDAAKFTVWGKPLVLVRGECAAELFQLWREYFENRNGGSAVVVYPEHKLSPVLGAIASRIKDFGWRARDVVVVGPDRVPVCGGVELVAARSGTASKGYMVWR